MITPRLGSSIWRRLDDGHTAVVETSVAIAECEHEDDVWAAAVEEGTWIFPCDGHWIEFEVESVLDHPVGPGGIVVLALECPPFGVWERLDSWTPATEGT